MNIPGVACPPGMRERVKKMWLHMKQSSFCQPLRLRTGSWSNSPVAIIYDMSPGGRERRFGLLAHSNAGRDLRRFHAQVGPNPHLLQTLRVREVEPPYTCSINFSASFSE